MNTKLIILQIEKILNFVGDKIENIDCTQNSQFYKIEIILNFVEDKIENIDRIQLPVLQSGENSQFHGGKIENKLLNTQLQVYVMEILNFKGKGNSAIYHIFTCLRTRL